MRYLRLTTLLALWLLVACRARDVAPPVTVTPVSADPVAAAFETMARRYPEWMTESGLSDLYGVTDDRLNDWSTDYAAETARLAAVERERLAALTVSAEDKLAVDILQWWLDDIAAGEPFVLHDYTLNFITGPHTTFPEFMQDVHPLENAADAAAYVARLQAVATQFDQLISGAREREAAGILPPRDVLEIVRWQIDGFLRPAELRNPLYTSFAARLAAMTDLDAAAEAELLTQVERALKRDVYPAYRALRDEVNRLIGATDDFAGVWRLPDGEAYYAYALRHFTSADITPDEAHALGLAEVARLQAEMAAMLDALGYPVADGNLAAALERAVAQEAVWRLRTSADRDAVLAENARVIAAAEAELAPLFDLMPATPLQVLRPSPAREGSGGAYYRSPPLDGSRPGLYYLQLAGPQIYSHTLRTTAYHEGVPGHHFQLALQAEQADLPLHQRALIFSGFAEGWALYAEQLASEAGLYTELPLGELGRLQMALLRAARVVVDTGIHHLRWTQTAAVDYLMTEVGLPRGQAESEVIRYIAWPGQAPGYTIGLLTILELRETAQAALGDEFSLPAFHNAILENGAVPLVVLEAHLAAEWGVP